MQQIKEFSTIIKLITRETDSFKNSCLLELKYIVYNHVTTIIIQTFQSWFRTYIVLHCAQRYLARMSMSHQCQQHIITSITSLPASHHCKHYTITSIKSLPASCHCQHHIIFSTTPLSASCQHLISIIITSLAASHHCQNHVIVSIMQL